METVHAQTGGELLSLPGPGVHKRDRADDKGRSAVVGGDPRQHLQGLAQPHVVGQDAADPVVGQPGQPVETGTLVGPQSGVHGSWDSGRARGRNPLGDHLVGVEVHPRTLHRPADPGLHRPVETTQGMPTLDIAGADP